MGYSVNRYFKPAIYTPMNTAVQYPFREMMEAAKIKQANTPKLQYEPKEVQGASGFRLASGDWVPLDDKELTATVQDQLEGHMSQISNAVSQGTMNPQEYGYLMQQATKAYEQTYSPNGVLGKLDKNRQAIEQLEKKKMEAKDLNITPWRAMDIDEQLLKYKAGEISEVNPNVGVDEYVDATKELNDLLTGVKSEGYAYANAGREGNPYMRSGSLDKIPPTKIKELFDNGFHNSRLMSTWQREMQYNIMTGKMTEDQAQQAYEDRVQSALDFVMKSVYSHQTAGIASDAYARGKEEERKAREGDYSVSGLTSNPIKTDLATTVNNIKSILTNPSLYGSPQHQAAMELVRQYGYDVPQGKTLTQHEKLVAFKNAAENAKQQNVEFYLFQNPKFSDVAREWLANTSGRGGMILGSGYRVTTGKHGQAGQSTGKAGGGSQNAGKFLGSSLTNLEDISQQLGYPSYQDLLKASTVQGVALTDMYGTGAGSFKATVFDKTKNRNVEVLISPNEKQSKYFEAAAILASPTHNMKAHTYYVPGPGGDYSQGYYTDTDPATLPTGQQPPVYYKSNNIITGIGSGNEKSAVNVDVMRLDAGSRQYTKHATTTPRAIFVDGLNAWIENSNIPNALNPGGEKAAEESSLNTNVGQWSDQ